MNNNIKKGINDFKLGDRIGKSGMIFVKRNVEKDKKSLESGQRQQYVEAVCPFCGEVKTYRFSYLKDGNNTSCGCMRGRHGHYTFVPQRKEDSCGNITYDKGYGMNFGWVYDDEAGVDTYGNRIINVHSKWVPEDKAIMPLKELDPVLNPDGIMMNARWAKSYIDANNIDLSELVTKEERHASDANINSTGNPYGRRHLSIDNNPYGQTVMAHGFDEYWIKSIILKDESTAKKVRNTAYVVDNDIFGKTTSFIGDCNSKYADLRIIENIDGNNVDVYEEYDGYGHSIKNPSERDVKVMFGCAENNKGLFRLSTNLKVFVERNEDAVLAIRKFAIERIQHNILHNYNVGYNEKPTIVRASQQRGIEEAILKDGQLVWCQIAKISDFLRIHC